MVAIVNGPFIIGGSNDKGVEIFPFVEWKLGVC